MPVSRISVVAAWSSSFGAIAVNRHAFFGGDRAGFVDRSAQHVHDAAERSLAYRHLNRRAGIRNLKTAFQTVGGTHGNGTYDAVAQLLLHFQRQIGGFDHQCIVNLRYRATRELDVHDGADNLNDITRAHWLFLLAAAAASQSLKSKFLNVVLLRHGRGAAHDLGDLLRDGGLARLVVDQLQFVDQVAGIVRRGLHRDHACRLFAGTVFNHRLVYQ